MTNHECHIKLWDELARTGDKKKFIIFEKLFPNAGRDAAVNACFACAEAKARYKTEPSNYCRRCPITWGEKDSKVKSYFCEKLDDSPFVEWKREDDCSVKEHKRLAAIIRDLPWKEKESC